jgi:hypothetical protein
VLGLLTWVAGMGNPWLGFLIFFTLSLGLGLPLFVLALFSGQLQRLPRAGGWMLWVRKLMGWVLVGMAAYFIRPVLPEALKIALPVAVALAAGLHLGWLDKNQAGFQGFSLAENHRGHGLPGPGDLLDHRLGHARTRESPGVLFGKPCGRQPNKTNRSSSIFTPTGARPAGSSKR